MKSSIKTLCLLITAIILSNYNSYGQSDNFDYGHIENGIYTNNYFNLKIILPANWVVQSKEQTESILDKGKKLLAGDDKKMSAIIKASEINSANLIAVFQYKLGSAVKYNPSIMIIAENIKNSPGIKNGSDYLFHTRRIMEQGQFKYDFLSKNFRKENIHDIDFYKMDARLTYMGIDIKQVYYSTVLKEFSFNVVISYITDVQKDILIQSINSISFKD